MSLGKTASQFDLLKKFIRSNDHFSKPLTRLFLIQRAFRKLEHHYHLNYRDFLDAFSDEILIELKPDSIDEMKDHGEEQTPESELVRDENSTRTSASASSTTSPSAFTDDEELVAMDSDDALEVINKFRGRLFRRMKRLVFTIFCCFFRAFL